MSYNESLEVAIMETKDLIVIGGGINGAGIAADAAGRGLSVLMLEARDLACATFQRSSKLIHGGLRYLEHYEFRLVSEALPSVLLKMAPHIAIPCVSAAPPSAPASGVDDPYRSVYVRSSGNVTAWPLVAFWRRIRTEAGNRARFRIFRLLGRRCAPGVSQRADGMKGGEVRTRTRAISAKRENGLWVVEAEDIDSGERFRWQAAVWSTLPVRG
jgi:glycerol-3-phosphate dehydrogenase